jgi:preprotein translocase subunit Sss1
MGAIVSRAASDEPPRDGFTNINGAYLVVFLVLGIVGLIFILRLVLCPNNRKSKN